MRDIYEEAADDAGAPEDLRAECIAIVRRRNHDRIRLELSDQIHELVMDEQQRMHPTCMQAMATDGNGRNKTHARS